MCEHCVQKSRKKSIAPMQHIPVGVPLEKVALDIMGPFQVSDSGNTHILVVSDYFTRWVEAYPIPDQTAQVVADKFVTEFVLRYGIPAQIHTDQGRDFMSNLFCEMAKLLGIEKTRTTPYHPMSDGLVERLNRTIQDMLRSFVNENRDDWEDHLPYVLSAYRSSVQESTGCSPNHMMFGREFCIPLTLLVGQPADNPPELCAVRYVEWLKQAMVKAFDFAREKMNLSAVRQKRNYNRKSVQSTLNVGDWVWLYDHVNSAKKLGKCWCGPFKIIQQISEVTFKIQKTPESRSKVVHFNNLTKCAVQPDTSNSWGDIVINNDKSTQTGSPPRRSSRERRPKTPYSPS